MELYRSFLTSIVDRLGTDGYFDSIRIFTDSDIPLRDKVQTQLNSVGICVYVPYPEFSREANNQVKLMQPVIVYENPTVNYDTGSYHSGSNKTGTDCMMRIWGNLEGYSPTDIYKPIQGTNGGSVNEDSGIISHMVNFDTQYTLQIVERV